MDEELEELIRVMEENKRPAEEIAAAVKEHEALKEAKAKQEQTAEEPPVGDPKKDTVKTEDKASKEAEEARVALLGYDSDEINLKNLKTVVNKSAGEVAAEYDSGELSSRYPGLNVTDTSFAIGNSIEFVLPDGTNIPVNLKPIFDSEEGVEAQLQKVDDWYEKNNERANLGIFRQLGERSDNTANVFDGSKLSQLNESIGLAGYEIKSNDDPSGMGVVQFQLVGPDGGTVANGDSSTGVANIQKYLWDNLTDADINDIREPASKVALQLVQARREQEELEYADLVLRPEDTAGEIKGDKEYYRKVELAVNESKLSDETKALINTFLTTDTTRRVKTGEVWGGLRDGYVDSFKTTAYSSNDRLEALKTGLLNGDISSLLEGDEGSFGIELEDPQEAIEELTRILKPGETYDAITTEEVVNKSMLLKANTSAQQWMSLLLTKNDQEGPQTFTNTEGEDVVLNVEAVAAALDNFKSNPDYLKQVMDPVIVGGVSKSYVEVEDTYEKTGEQMIISFKAEQDALLQLIQDEGLGYSNESGQLIIVGEDKALVDKYQGKWNAQKYNQRELAGEWDVRKCI